MVGIAGALALLVAIRDTRSVLFDDAAITFRYAWRIADGRGFTFNDGDRTNGASAPLYTLLLAAGSRAGLDLETSAKALGAACYALSCAMVAWLGGRLGGARTAALAALLLLVTPQYRHLALSGMESGMAATLGLAALCGVAARREVLAGMALGLAVTNKLDAGLLAIAIAVAWTVVQGRPPLRLAGIAAAVAAPWLVFSSWYFGSPVPYSATQKMGPVRNSAYDHDPLWLVRSLGTDNSLVLAALAVVALALVPAIGRRDRSGAAALAAAVGWAIAHLVAFSLVDLGDAYPWYLTVAYPPLCLGAAVTCDHLVGLAFGGPAQRTRAAALGASSILAVVAVSQLGSVARTAQVVRDGHRVDANEAFEADRRAAGLLLADLAKPDEAVRSCFGWVAYAVPTNPIDETCPLSTRDPVDDPTWGVELLESGTGADALPADTTVVATRVARGEPGRRFVVYRFDRSASSS